MRLTLRAAAAGIAIVVAFAVAIAVLPRPGADATPEPTPTSLYRSAPDLLPSGAYVIDELFERPISLEVPANWTGLGQGRGKAHIVKTLDAQPFGEVGPTVLLGIYAIDSVYADPCRDRAPAPRGPASVVAFVAALTHAVGVQAGRIEDTTVGGRPATVFDLRSTINMDDCLNQPFSQWSIRDERGVGHGNGTSSGGHQRIWLLDVDGTILLIDADSGDDSVADDVEELYQIVESIRFE